MSPRHLSCNYNKVVTMSPTVNKTNLQAKGKCNVTVRKSSVMNIPRCLTTSSLSLAFTCLLTFTFF